MLKRILIVDDDIELLEIMEEALTYYGFNVKAVLNASGIMNIIYDFKPDIILLDNVLPGERGVDVCAKVRRDKVFTDLPVILITAYPELDPSGYFNFLLHKPFDLDILVEKINELLEDVKKDELVSNNDPEQSA